MEWVPLNGYEADVNMENIPRKLTEKEIKYITDRLPLSPSADYDSAEVARRGTVEWMIQTLKEVSIDPSLIPKLVEGIVEQHTKSLLVPGTPIGRAAAEAVGATTTQMTLNTFHSSGSSKSASFGIEAMRDLIFARKVPKNEACTIYFTDKQISFEEALNSRQYIVGSLVSDFVKDYDIDDPEVLDRYWWHDNAELLFDKPIPNSSKVLRLYLNVVEMYKQKVTITELAQVLQREVPPSVVAIYGPIADGIIDLYPHPDIIFSNLSKAEKGIIPADLAQLAYFETSVLPELKNIRVKGVAGLSNLVPIVSPVWRMVLTEKKINSETFDTIEMVNILKDYIEQDSAWMLIYNDRIMRFTGLTPDNLAALCQLAGFTIVGGNDLYLIVSLPADRFRADGQTVTRIDNLNYYQINGIEYEGNFYKYIPSATITPLPTGWLEKGTTILQPEEILLINDTYLKLVPQNLLLQQDNLFYEQITDNTLKIVELKPSEYILDKVNEAKLERNKLIKQLTDEVAEKAKDLPEEERRLAIRNPVNVPRSPIMIAAEFLTAEVDGGNLKDLLALPGIDKTRTTCNNMYTITATLGTEAARVFLIRALYNTISNTGSYVHPANITFIAEFITSRGEPYGATYTGISRQPGGHLSLATLERAGKVFTQNALYGRKEDIRNVSASVAVGARMAIGDGMFDIAQNITENGVEKTVINDDLFTALERDDKSKELIITQEAPTMTVEDLEGGLDLIKNITIGNTFDDVADEDATNLLTLFDTETIAELTTGRGGDKMPGLTKVVRRVQTPTQPDTQRELIDVLTLIKAGVPLTEETPVTTPVETTTPVITTGIISLQEIIQQTVDTGVPDDLEELFKEYIDKEERVTVTQELPRVEIPELPDLTGVDIARVQTEIKKEQVRNLQMIDTDQLKAAMNK